MTLARAAAARALTDWAEPEAPPTAEPEPLSEQAAEAPITQPAPTKPRRTATASAASPKQADPAVLFTRLAAVVRACIALESRIAAGAPEAPSATTFRPADPRLELLREGFGIVIKNHPDRAKLMREATTRLDEKLATDPDHALQPARFLIAVCEDLGIELDLGKLADKYLFKPKKPAPHSTRAPVPQATYPP